MLLVEVLTLPREKIDEVTINDTQKMRILSNSATFSAGRRSVPTCIIFRPQWQSYLQHLSFEGCGFPKIFSDEKYASNYGTVAYC